MQSQRDHLLRAQMAVAVRDGVLCHKPLPRESRSHISGANKQVNVTLCGAFTIVSLGSRTGRSKGFSVKRGLLSYFACCIPRCSFH